MEYIIGNLCNGPTGWCQPDLEGVDLALQYMDKIKISRNLTC